jgi:exodeoxyribonuclease-3
MKIITWNVNGIRAVERKGEIQKLVQDEKPDVLMIQEIKGTPAQFSSFLTEHEDYRQHYSSAEKKGYAGTSIWISALLDQEVGEASFSTKIPRAPNADEGRLSQLTFERNGQRWDMLSIYFPNGGKSEQAWEEKLVFYDKVHNYMKLLKKRGSCVLVGGDMNVAHTEIDIARPKENDGKIGFHPKERAWMDRLAADGWADVWRERNPGVTDVYSWWHMITRGRDRNVGWRIDYFLMEKAQLDQVADVAYLNDQMGSDHCPMMITVK